MKQGQHPDRNRQATNLAPTHGATAIAVPRKHYVSAARVFKKPSLRVNKKVHTSSKKGSAARTVATVSKSGQKPHNGNARSSSTSLQKDHHGKRSNTHPLALAFQDSSDAYRTHLYEKVTANLDAALESLVTQLRSSNLATVSSSSSRSGPDATLNKLTLAAKYDDTIEKAFRPIGDYVVDNIQQKNDGAKIIQTSLLKEKLNAFEEYHMQEFEGIKKLEAQWEKVVGEIYKTGVSCLGEEAMKQYLVGSEASPPSSPLFVPEPKNKNKKRVTFQEPQPEYPSFLSGPSLYKKCPITSLPTLPEDEVWRLEDAVGSLGAKQIEELVKIETEQSKWWKKKCEQIAQTLKAD